MKTGGMRGLRLGLACAALALAVLPGAANASEARPKGHAAKGTEVFVDSPQGPTASFRVRGSNGYIVEFAIAPEDSNITTRRETGSEGNETDEYANYDLLGGRATMQGARVNFGGIGRVSVTFRPSGKAHRFKDEHCKGGPEVLRRGTFEGTIRFEGEHGFTRVVAKRARGELSFTPQQVCREPKIRIVHHHHEDPGPQVKVTSFFASAGNAKQTTFFSAVQSENEPGISKFNAESLESRGDLFIERNVQAEAPLGAFSVDPALNSATVSPPAPFSGSASFQRIDDFASRWQGPLTVSFPGRPDVPLTGRAYAWFLAQEGEPADDSIASGARRARQRRAIAARLTG